jgi:uncharacterized protein YkwD
MLNASRALRRRVDTYWVALAISACATLPLPASRSPNVPAPAADVAAMEHQVHELINRHRTQRGLPPLQLDAYVSAIAREHSRDMLAGVVPFGHAGFEARGAAIAERVAYRNLAENVAWNDHPAEHTADVAVQGWLQSAGHRSNIEGTFQLTGVGIARSPAGAWYYTQIFIVPR